MLMAHIEFILASALFKDDYSSIIVHVDIDVRWTCEENVSLLFALD
jgi:hypothetical protein